MVCAAKTACGGSGEGEFGSGGTSCHAVHRKRRAEFLAQHARGDLAGQEDDGQPGSRVRSAANEPQAIEAWQPSTDAGVARVHDMQAYTQRVFETLTRD